MRRKVKFIFSRHFLVIMYVCVSLESIVECREQQSAASLPSQSSVIGMNNAVQISFELNRLSVKTKNKVSDKYINKTIQLATSQALRYSSTVLSPIYLLDKQGCHAHEGTLEVSKLQDISFHESSSPNQQVYNQKEQYLQQQSWIFNKKYSLLYRVCSSLKVDAYAVNQELLGKKTQKLLLKQQIQGIYRSQSSQKIIKHLTSIHLVQQHSTINGQPYPQNCNYSEQSQILLTLSQDYQIMYIFSCSGIYMIQCKSVLAKFQSIAQFSDLSPSKEQTGIFYGIELEKVHQYVFWLSQSQGIRIYGKQIDMTLQYIQTIKVQPSSTKLSSLQYRNGLLFILTLNAGIYVYQRLTAFHFVFTSYIQYLPELVKINKELIVLGNQVLIWTQARKWEFVAQIMIIEDKDAYNSKQDAYNSKQDAGNSKKDAQSDKGKVVNSEDPNKPKVAIPANNSNNSFKNMSLVFSRYFKGYRSISQIKLIQGNQFLSSQPHLNSQESAKIKTQGNKNRLLIISEKGFELFPLEKDARQISIVSNGIGNNHIGDQISSIWQVNEGVYILQSFLQRLSTDWGDMSANNPSGNPQSLVSSTFVHSFLVLINIVYPQIQCRFQRQGKYTILVEQQYLGQNDQPLEKGTTQLPDTPPNKNHYQSHQYHRLLINVTGQSSWEHVALIVSVLGMAVLFLVIALLIYWRQKKLDLIDALKEQIRKLKIITAKSVEFEESSLQKPKQTRWDELRQQIQGQVSYNIQDVQEDNQLDNNMMSDRNLVKNSQAHYQPAQGTREKYQLKVQIRNPFKTKNKQYELNQQQQGCNSNPVVSINLKSETESALQSMNQSRQKNSNLKTSKQDQTGHNPTKYFQDQIFQNHQKQVHISVLQKDLQGKELNQDQC